MRTLWAVSRPELGVKPQRCAHIRGARSCGVPGGRPELRWRPKLRGTWGRWRSWRRCCGGVSRSWALTSWRRPSARRNRRCGSSSPSSWVRTPLSLSTSSRSPRGVGTSLPPLPGAAGDRFVGDGCESWNITNPLLRGRQVLSRVWGRCVLWTSSPFSLTPCCPFWPRIWRHHALIMPRSTPCPRDLSLFVSLLSSTLCPCVLLSISINPHTCALIRSFRPPHLGISPAGRLSPVFQIYIFEGSVLCIAILFTPCSLSIPFLIFSSYTIPLFYFLDHPPVIYSGISK